MKIYNQLNYKKNLLGTSKTSTIANYGCKLCCLAIMVQKDPVEVNKILVKAGAFFGRNGDLMNDTIAAKALGLQYFGSDSNINHVPKWTPNIKEVDQSPARGKQQHFVLRSVNSRGKKCILDPWGGVERALNFYPFVSYRLFKK